MTYRQTWAARIQLEAACHEYSVFFTLTYAQEHLPNPPQLQPEDLQKFLKRVRRRLEPVQVRFFACGEYGSKSLRPHYHGVLFGVEATNELERILAQAWPFGFIQLAPLTPARAAYVAKYVCKDVSEDEKIPPGWQKEFARMSNRPGIGAKYAEIMSAKINAANDRQVVRGYPLLTELLGGSMRIGPVYYPVSRYLRDRLKKQVILGHSSDLSKALAREREFKTQLFEPQEVPEVKKHRRAEVRRRLRKSRGTL